MIAARSNLSEIFLSPAENIAGRRTRFTWAWRDIAFQRLRNTDIANLHRLHTNPPGISVRNRERTYNTYKYNGNDSSRMRLASWSTLLPGRV